MPDTPVSHHLRLILCFGVLLIVCHGHNDALVVDRPRIAELDAAGISRDTGLAYQTRSLQQLQSSVASCQPVEYLCGTSELVLDVAYSAITAGPCTQEEPGGTHALAGDHQASILFARPDCPQPLLCRHPHAPAQCSEPGPAPGLAPGPWSLTMTRTPRSRPAGAWASVFSSVRQLNPALRSLCISTQRRAAVSVTVQ